MKVIVEREASWKLEVDCKKSDWREDKLHCGSTLEVNQDDIVYREWSKYPDESGKDFGVICPVCGCFVKIEVHFLPEAIMAQARNYLDVIREQREGSKEEIK